MSDPPDARTTAIVEASFAFAPGCGVSFSDTLEVSLDCPVCRKIGRMVVFDLVARTAVCTPTGHAFPGAVLDRSSGRNDAGRTAVTYRLRYENAEFVDPKHHHPSVRHPTWGRVHFRLTCPGCGHGQDGTTQNNLGRPRAMACGRCGLELYRDDAEMPRFRAFDAAGRLLYRHDFSGYELRLGSRPADLSAFTVRVLCDVAGIAPGELARLAAAGLPVYEQNAYGIAEPLRFSENLTRMASALVRDGAEFRLLHNGRDLKPAYVWRSKYGDTPPPG